MIVDVLKTIYIIIGTYLIGFGIKTFIYKNQRENVFLTLSISFLFGNLFLLILLNSLMILSLLNLGLIIFFMIIIAIIVYLFILGAKCPDYIDIKSSLKELFCNKFLIVYFLILFSAIMLPYFFRPLDVWDARAIWLIKAKSFVYENGFPIKLFLNPIFGMAHLDYPIGLPLLMSLYIRIYGHMNEQALSIYILLFYFNFFILTTGFIKKLFYNLNNLLIVLFLSSIFLTQSFLFYAGSAYADTPLSLCFQLTVAFFCLSIISRSNKTIYIVIAISAAFFGINIKNEGLPFFIITFIFLFITNFSSKGFNYFIRNNYRKPKTYLFLFIFFMLFIPYLLWLNKKQQLTISNDIISQAKPLWTKETINKICTIYTFYTETLFNSKYWGVWLLPIISLTCGFVVFSFLSFRKLKYLIPIFIIVGQFIVYLIMYLLTPHDLTWHLTFSIVRLFMHLIPASYIYFIFIIRTILVDSDKKYIK